jgi:ABC-type phosphate/phosphonate transport system substrate-binding protein
MKNSHLSRREAIAMGLSAAALTAGARVVQAADKPAFTMVIMDPLALPLSCPCVKGYAQRNYDKLGEFLEKQTGHSVRVVFDESLSKAVRTKTEGKADIVIGKHSVVKADAKKLNRGFTHVAALTGKDGKTTQTGLVVIPSKDPARRLSDLNGYRIIFGPEECDEKHSAALALLRQHKVTVEKKLETCSACSDGATTILELGPDVRAATVISSYAAPLLEGCGTIKKGDLRVLGTTDPVPFVAAFISDSLSQSERDSILHALLKVGEQPELLSALETKSGFEAAKTLAAKKK